MIAQRIYTFIMLILFLCSWYVCRSSMETIRRAHETQARQIERILALE